MKNFSVNSIESFSTVDGPGIRFVVFFNGCKLRCKYCHNPEMFVKKQNNYSILELYKMIINNKDYYNNIGGVTFSGGEPLLWSRPLLKLCKMLKKSNINIAIETAGCGKDYQELLKHVDLVILDIKAYDKVMYKYITGYEINDLEKFINICQRMNKRLWIRNVIVPSINDTLEYILGLKDFISKFNNVEKIELLPYHTMAVSKYKDLHMNYALDNILDMDKIKCLEWEQLLNRK